MPARANPLTRGPQAPRLGPLVRVKIEDVGVEVMVVVKLRKFNVGVFCLDGATIGEELALGAAAAQLVVGMLVIFAGMGAAFAFDKTHVMAGIGVGYVFAV